MRPGPASPSPGLAKPTSPPGATTLGLQGTSRSFRSPWTWWGGKEVSLGEEIQPHRRRLRGSVGIPPPRERAARSSHHTTHICIQPDSSHATTCTCPTPRGLPSPQLGPASCSHALPFPTTSRQSPAPAPGRKCLPPAPSLRPRPPPGAQGIQETCHPSPTSDGTFLILPALVLPPPQPPRAEEAPLPAEPQADTPQAGCHRSLDSFTLHVLDVQWGTEPVPAGNRRWETPPAPDPGPPAPQLIP